MTLLRRRPDPHESATGEPASHSRPSVLVVDDNAIVRRGLARVLQRDGLAVRTVANGLEALLEIQRRPYDALVLDIMMPVMDGIVLYRRLSRDHPDAARRVVFVTAWADDPEIQEFLDATARPILQKPFELDSLLSAVREVTGGASRSSDGTIA